MRLSLAVAALSLLRVTVDEKAAIHRVVQAADFGVHQKRTGPPLSGLDDFLKAILMIAHFFGDQAAALQVSISPGKIGHIDGDMVPVVRCQRRFGFPK